MNPRSDPGNLFRALYPHRCDVHCEDFHPYLFGGGDLAFGARRSGTVVDWVILEVRSVARGKAKGNPPLILEASGVWGYGSRIE